MMTINDDVWINEINLLQYEFLVRFNRIITDKPVPICDGSTCGLLDINDYKITKNIVVANYCKSFILINANFWDLLRIVYLVQDPI